MCLALIAWQHCANEPLVVGFNRDEFFDRPTKLAQNWGDYIGGQDCISQGTWLGVSNSRFGAVTNLRKTFEPGIKSRGQLVRQFVAGHDTAVEYANQLNHDQYNHFNLVLCDGNNLVVTTNPKQKSHILSPGIYVITNDEFDPAITNCLTSKFSNDVDKLFELLEQNHVRKDLTYGTRTSTVITNNSLFERTYNSNGFLQNQLQINKS